MKKKPILDLDDSGPSDSVRLGSVLQEVSQTSNPSRESGRQTQLAAKTAAAATPGPAGLTTAYCSTYSIVARCPETGRLGVAVESHWFDVRNTVAWVQPGVGAVATQAATNQAFGPRGLSLMEQGQSPHQALAVLESEDPVFARRQVGMVDTQGRVAGHTGELCVGHASSYAGDGYVAQANLMENEGVPEAMGQAFENTEGPLEKRLMAALRAAEKKGGDIRGGQSAALVVMEGESSGNPLLDRVVDLTVPDHPHPVEELGRLLKLHQDYSGYGDLLEKAKNGETQAVKGMIKELSPEAAELRFWSALELFNAGEKKEACGVLEDLFARKPGFRAVLPRLVPAQILAEGSDQEILQATGSRATVSG